MQVSWNERPGILRKIRRCAHACIICRWSRKVPRGIGCRPTDAEIGKTVFHHDIRIIEVPAIDHDGITKSFIKAVEIQRGEFGPVGQDEEGVGIFRCRVGVVYITETRAWRKNLLRSFDCGWVVGGDGTAFGEEHFDDVNCGRLANVVGLSLEGEAENAEAFAAEGPQGRANLIEKAFLLLSVDLLDFGEEVEVDAQLFCHGSKGGDVFGKARAAVANAGAEEFRADAAVESHAAGDLLDIGIGGLAEVRDGVDERDFESKKRVGGVFDDLRAFGGGQQKWRRLGCAVRSADGVRALVVFAGGKREVDAAKHGSGSFVVGTDDDTVRVEEVGYSGSFAKKLRIGYDVEQVPGNAIAFHRTGDPLVGVDRDGTFFDDDFVAGERAGYLAGNGFDIREIRVAALALRSSDGNKDGFTFAGSFGEISHEANFCVAILFQKLGEEVLVDERVSGLEGGDLALVVVDADDIVAYFSETDGSNQTDIPGPNNGNSDVFAHSADVLFLIVEDN